MPDYPPLSVQDDPKTAQEQLPRAWELHDPYKYAPPKADEDSWHIVLEPLLKKDKMRCEAWKDEVQNLLIFAGLFSAVATSFVIESYKSLQADPLNDLLLIISASQSNTSVTIPPFSPTPSGIRINIFWFMSLVLSLTTVLVGIVCLQWLREHQSYPDLTPKQIFALFHMRSEGLQKWHVPRIFSALPLLLQAALVLFFAGMIDFLLSLQKIVAIPIIVIIGLTSVFLVATTIIPTFQGIPFYFPFLYSSEHPPAQCAYKSPQSHAFRTLSQFTFRGLSYVLPIIYALPQKLGLKKSRTRQHHLIPSIASTWNDAPWVQFDLAWLSIRDAYMQGIYDCETDLHLHRHKWDADLPLYDVAKGLREVVEFKWHNSLHTETFLAAIHYCFEEISISIMDRQKSFNDPADGFGNQERRNRYFRRIIQDKAGRVVSNGRRSKKDPALSTLSDFLCLNDGWGLRGWEAWEVLHHENMLVFLSQVVLTRHRSQRLSMHAMELQTRMVRDLLGKPRKIKTGWDRPKLERELPPSLLIDYAGFKDELSKCRNPVSQTEFCYQYANIVKSFFCAVADFTDDSHQMKQSLDTTFHTQRQMLVLITEAGWISAYVLNFCHKFLDGEKSLGGQQESILSSEEGSSAILARQMVHVFVSTIHFIGQQLEREMQDSEKSDRPTPSHQEHSAADSSLQREGGINNMYMHTQDDPYEMTPILPTASATGDVQSPSLLFYVACLYIKPLTQQHHEAQSPMSNALQALKLILRRYYYTRITPSRSGSDLRVPLPTHTQTPSSSQSRSFARSNAALLDGLRHPENENSNQGGRRTRNALEDRWRGVEEDGVERFSERWWRFILSDGRTL